MASKLQSHSITSNVLLSTLGTTFVTVVIVMALAIYSSKDALENASRHQLMDQAETISQDVTLYFQQRIADARMISQADVLETLQPAPIETYFHEILEANEELTALSMIDLNQAIMASTCSPRITGKPLSTMNDAVVQLYQAARDARQGYAYLTDAVLIDPETPPSVFLLLPITDQSNTVTIAVLVVEVTLQTLAEKIYRINGNLTNNDEYIYLLNENNEVLVTQDLMQEIMRGFYHITGNNTFLEKAKRTRGDETYVTPEGVDVIAGIADIHEVGRNRALNWGVVAVAEAEKVAAPAHRLQERILAITLAALLLAALIALFLSRTITSSLSKLVWNVQSLSQSDFSPSFEVAGPTEIQTLSAAFKTMTENLQERMTAEARTREGLNKENLLRREAYAELERNQENLRVTLNSIGDAVIATDEHAMVTRLNPAAATLTGWSPKEATGKPISVILRIIDSNTREPIIDPIMEVLKSGTSFDLADNITLISKTGKEFRIADSIAPIRDNKSSQIYGLVVVFRDITEQLRLEEDLRHSQKMDAIGQLAGGVAHDFNNMLGGIIGAADLLTTAVPAEEQDLLELIVRSADQARHLSNKLLAFARKGDFISVAFDVRAVVNDVAALLTHTVDRRIEIDVVSKAQENFVLGDISLLQTALLNLAVNARDAMPDGGRISLITENVELDEHYCQASKFDILPGQYVMLSVKDTGCGIPFQAIEHIFEPYYTTRLDQGGSGLGLAAVYGTVKEHRGAITVYSEPGMGAIFHVYLPVHQQEPKAEVVAVPSPAASSPSASKEVPRGRGCVLIVDDEEVIRLTAKRILEELGYEVLVASNGEDGILTYMNHRDEIDVILLDMIMPKLNGKQVFMKIHAENPEAKMIISSGFTRDERLDDIVELGLCGFIKKPYHREELARAIAAVLAGEIAF